jgi:hypothetical protein
VKFTADLENGAVYDVLAKSPAEPTRRSPGSGAHGGHPHYPYDEK